MGNQPLGIDLVRPDGLEQHRYGGGVDQPCGDCDIVVPQAFQVESHFLSMHPDIGDVAAGRDDFFTHLEGGRNAHRLDGGVDTAIAGHLHDRLHGLAIGTVDASGGAEVLCHFKTIVVEIDHDDL